MRRKLPGVREITKGARYEINYIFAGKRYQYRIDAVSITEAYNKKLKDIADKEKDSACLLDNGRRLNASFSSAWERLVADLTADSLPKKTIQHYEKTYNRLFKDFLKLRFPYIETFNQLGLPYFKEYKNYYVNDLGRPNGWRAELIFVKAIIRRLYCLGYCTKDLVDSLAELKKPRHNKKEYASIPNSKIKELLQVIKKERPDYYYPIYFISRTGRRINETTLIEKRDVEWRGFIPAGINIRAETTKTRQSAPLRQLDQYLQTAIKEVYGKSSRHKEKYLFLNRHGRRCLPDKIRQYLKAKSREVIGKAITPHYFRHRFLTECGKASLAVVDVMTICGIKDINVVVKYYSHSTVEGQSKVLEVSRV